MSALEDARGEAERRVSEEMHSDAVWGAVPYKVGFIEGVEWALASRESTPDLVEWRTEVLIDGEWKPAESLKPGVTYRVRQVRVGPIPSGSPVTKSAGT